MERILGIDLGTNSIGWALVERDEEKCTLFGKGVNIFQEGVARDNGKEKPAVQDRTEARALRRHYFRRRLRKIELLRVLVKYGLCPPLTEKQLKEWKLKKVYPFTEAFISWQRTDDKSGRNPYYDRYRALTEKLDLETIDGRYSLGRALYHLVQRRGFISNRKCDDSGEDGKVKASISELSAAMKNEGCKYLGEYFYRLYLKGEKIRTCYTSRKEHCEAEFLAICEKQNITGLLQEELKRAMFYQRPLKSQKGLVGKCTFERHKNRCPVSHPRFEEFRMLSFVNNIRMARPGENCMKPLNEDDRSRITPLFMRKSKSYFDFEDIAKKIAGKGAYLCKGDSGSGHEDEFYRFNYARTATVSGCPVTAELADVFGNHWLDGMCSVYTLAGEKNVEQILNDVWHALFFFTDKDLLKAWAVEKLQLGDGEAEKFAGIKILQGYASLSLNAINKILPFLRAGLRYDSAVFVANLKAVLPENIAGNERMYNSVVNDVASIVDDFADNPLNKGKTKEQVINDYLRNNYEVNGQRLARLYHPSTIDVYPKAQPDDRGAVKLGSPRTSAVRNPMAMRALFRLRILINKLLASGTIDKYTKINIEFARELNDANRRKAIEQEQRDREAENKNYEIRIRELYAEATGKNIDPTADDILKYRLWEEQKHICLYTGKEIGIEAFIGEDPEFDIEHTVPRSRGGDNSQQNKTLCEKRFNREIKHAKLPSELSNYNEVLERIETLGWKDKIASIQKQIERQKRNSKAASTKENKDKAIQQCRYLQMKLDYVRGKYERFTMREVLEGFSNRQGVDIGIIGKYAREYLKTVFERIYTVKGVITAEFRKMWGLQEEYSKKERVNHIHHCIDAITIACIGPNEYRKWAQYKRNEENYEYGIVGKPCFEKPWDTFTEDVKAVADDVLVSHYTPDNMPKQTKKKLRIRGKIKQNSAGNPIYIQGDTARGSLHNQTFYGAIESDGRLKYVVRKRLIDLKPDDIKNIVDGKVKELVKDAVAKFGLKDIQDPDKTECTVWMNEEKKIPIHKVRIFANNVTQPINLKKQRDLSSKDYKQYYHVANESNYCMAIYEGLDSKGKTVRGFKVINNLEAAQHFKTRLKAKADSLVLPVNEKGLPLKYIIKTGTMVLFYEDSPEELRSCTKAELVKRLYKVTKFSRMVQQNRSYGTITFRHHEEARKAKDLKSKGGVWKRDESYRPLITLLHTQMNACVEGFDFELTVTGEVIFKR